MGLAIVIASGCQSKSPPAAETHLVTPMEANTLFDQADDPPTLSGLILPPAERELLEDLITSDPAQVLALSRVTVLDVENAHALARFVGKVIILDNLARLGPAEAAALATWPGETLVLGIPQLDAVTAAKLARWKGKSLHLDRVEDLDASTSTALAEWGGVTLGLARMRGSSETIAPLAKFGGFVVVRPIARAPHRHAVGAPPPAATREELATLKRISRAVDESDMVTLRDYLRRGGSPDNNERGTTLLMEATNMKQLEPAQLLVAANANVNAVNQDGHTPLYYALDDFRMPGDPPDDPKVVFALVQLLVEAGAEIEPPVVDSHHRPLAQAARRGDVRLISYLLAKGADARRLDALKGSALIDAINGGHAAAVKLLIAAGAPVEVVAPGPGRSPIHQAISQGAMAIEMARFERKDAKHVSALVSQWLSVLELVLAAGPNLAVRDDAGRTPLATAINGGVPELLERVLDTKPDLDHVDERGNTGLQFLADLPRLDEPALIPLAKLLLARGADRKIRTADGQTAADIAAKRDFRTLAALLR